jgi:hypothetical protein
VTSRNPASADLAAGIVVHEIRQHSRAVRGDRGGRGSSKKAQGDQSIAGSVIPGQIRSFHATKNCGYAAGVPRQQRDSAPPLRPAVPQAIAFGDVLFVAVPYGALPELGQDYGDALKGKVVLDACNAVAARDSPTIADEVEQNGIGITSQKYLPGTRLVRAFNTLNYTIFAREANRKLAVPIAACGWPKNNARRRVRACARRHARGRAAVPARRAWLRSAGDRARA